MRSIISVAVGAIGLGLGLAACGSNSSSSSAAHSASTSTIAPSTTAPASAGTRPIHATLVGANHQPVANKLWPYTVTATNAGGRPLPGTVDIEFTFNGVVVGHDTPPTHPLKQGRWHDTLTFPAQSVGEPIDVQAVVHTSIGSVTLDWPIKVKP